MIKLNRYELMLVVKYIVSKLSHDYDIKDMSLNDIYNLLNGKEFKFKYKKERKIFKLSAFSYYEKKPYIIFELNDRVLDNSIDIHNIVGRGLYLPDKYSKEELELFVDTFFLEDNDYCYLVNIPYRDEIKLKTKTFLNQVLHIFLITEYELLFNSKIKLMSLMKYERTLKEKYKYNELNMQNCSNNEIIVKSLNQANLKILEGLQSIKEQINIEIQRHQSLQNHLFESDIKKQNKL